MKEQLYDRLAELARFENVADQKAAILRQVWTEQVWIYQQLLQMNCNQLPSDAKSVEERLAEKSSLLRSLK